MKICYWGTAAAEGIPAIFCNCDVCKEAREKKDRYIRTRSQLLIDDTLMLDFNADTYAHLLKYGFNAAQLKDVIVTHIHGDHYYPEDISLRREGYCTGMKYPTLTFHGSEDLLTQYEYSQRGDLRPVETGRIAFDVLQPYKWSEIAGFRVVPLPATHGTPHPMVYLLQKEGKTAFILNDSGILKDEVFAWIKDSGIKFDLVSYDCTMGCLDTIKAWGDNASHMGIPNILAVRERLKANGNYKDDTVSVITHFSHNGEGVGYGDMLKTAEKYGFVLAYDGMTVEI